MKCEFYKNFILFISLFTFLSIVNIRLSVAEKLGCEGAKGMIWMVKAQKGWQTKDAQRFYRVLVFRNEGKNPRDKIQVQIIETVKKHNKKQGKPESKMKVVKCFWLDEPGNKGYVYDISFNDIVVDIAHLPELKGLLVDIKMRKMEGIILRAIYALNPNGTFKKISSTSYVNIHDDTGFKKSSIKLH